MLGIFGEKGLVENSLDEKAIVVQDILEELKDTALSSQFFLCLLEDLTTMVEDNKEGFDVELPDAGEGDNVEKQILDLEDHLDIIYHVVHQEHHYLVVHQDQRYLVQIQDNQLQFR